MMYANFAPTFDDAAYDAASTIRLHPSVKSQCGSVFSLEERRRQRDAAAGDAPALNVDAIMASLDAKSANMEPTTRLVAQAVAQLLLRQALSECAPWAIEADGEDGGAPLAARSHDDPQAAYATERSGQDVALDRAQRKPRTARRRNATKRVPSSSAQKARVMIDVDTCTDASFASRPANGQEGYWLRTRTGTRRCAGTARSSRR